MYMSLRTSLYGGSLLAVVCCLRPAIASAQSPTLSGVVVDKRGAPLLDTEVSLRGLNRAGRTDSTGQFRFMNVAAGNLIIEVRRLGYQPHQVDVVVPVAPTLVNLRIVLEDGPVELAAVDVGAPLTYQMEGFYRRRANGSGSFVTSQEIDARRPSRLSDMVRNLPGIRVERVGTTRSTLRFTGSATMRPNCMPQYWLDGRLVRDADIDDFPPGDVAGIELYSGPATTPLQFSAFGPISSCGAVVIWTRQKAPDR